MGGSTKPALFRFHVINNIETTYIEHTHPVPTFLCMPTQSQQDSQAFREAFVDVISVVTNQHHEKCMRAITTPCVSCCDPATDALKSPMSYLHLAEPMVVVQVTPVCGSEKCEYQVRAQLLEMQNKMRGEGEEHEKNIYGKMNCAVCGTENAKRCAGCGRVAYCGKECQKGEWKRHKKMCQRRNLAKSAGGVGLPYEQI